MEANPPAGESTSLPPGAETGDETWSMSPGTVEISPERQQLIGVRVGVVEKKPLVHTLRILGRVEADETKIYRINASVDGWIEKAYDNSVGSLVKKGEVLATFSNPQFLDAEQGYKIGCRGRFFWYFLKSKLRKIIANESRKAFSRVEFGQE